MLVSLTVTCCCAVVDRGSGDDSAIRSPDRERHLCSTSRMCMWWRWRSSEMSRHYYYYLLSTALDHHAQPYFRRWGGVGRGSGIWLRIQVCLVCVTAVAWVACKASFLLVIIITSHLPPLTPVSADPWRTFDLFVDPVFNAPFGGPFHTEYCTRCLQKSLNMNSFKNRTNLIIENASFEPG